MYHLFYASCSSSFFKGRDDIDSILGKAHLNNLKAGLSGILLYHSGIFLQLLEGEENDVKKIFSKIFNDSRHNNIQILFEGQTSERIFANWKMAFKDIDELDIKMVNEILSWNRLIQKNPDVDSELILKMLRQFRSRITNEDFSNLSKKAI